MRENAAICSLDRRVDRVPNQVRHPLPVPQKAGLHDTSVDVDAVGSGLMGASLNEVYWIEVLLFYVLALGIVFLPLRWSLVCLLLAGSVEVIQSGFVASTSIGWENVGERLVLPTLLLLRMTRFRLPRIKWGAPSKAWAVLVLYAAISILWSPFKLSGLKMVAYLAAWFVLYLVFHLAWYRGLLGQKIVIAALWGSLALACFQTYILGNPLWGTTVVFGPFASPRFAPFVGPQSFGPFLACLLALLLFSKERNALRSLSIGACLLALVLAGSRYALIEAATLVFARCLLWARAVRTSGKLRLRPVLGILLLAVVVFFAFRATMEWAMPGSRVNQLLELESQPDVAEEGTFGWRLLVYEHALTNLSDRSITELAFGSGTSSGAEVATVALWGSPESFDPNRTIHDEFLRAEYEWGVIGLGLGLGLLIYAARALWARAFHLRSLAGFAALAIMPGILLALLVENPLAGPGSAEGLGYLLVLTYGFAFGRRAYSAENAGTGCPPQTRPSHPAAGLAPTW